MGMLAARPGRTHRWSLREDADGLTPRLNLPARIGVLERARETDTTEAKGGLWSPKAGLGKVFRSLGFQTALHGPEGEQGLGWEALLPTATAASACTIGVGGQGGRVV